VPGRPGVDVEGDAGYPMEKDANYVAVGAFIIVVVAMAVGFVLWYSGARDGRDYGLYEIYFTGSVSGLDRGSPVRYLGVDVGRVRQLVIDRENPGRVKVIAEIDESTPISSATRASLHLQGVTGLLYVNLRESVGVPSGEPLPRGERYPVIESAVSDFDVLLASLPELVGRASTVLERLGELVSERNVASITDSIGSLQRATAALPETTRAIALLIEEVRATVGEIEGAAASVRSIATDAQPQLSATLAHLAQGADSLAAAAGRIERLAERSEVQLGHFGETGLFEMERLVRETRAAAREFRELSRSLKENPSQILYEPPRAGVEIAP